MANVRDLIQQYESRVPRMSSDLQRFLDLVWSHRNDPHLDIYALYTGSPAFSRPWVTRRRVSAAQIQTFLNGIISVGREPEIQGSDETYNLINYRPSRSQGGYVRRNRPLNITQLRDACSNPQFDWLVQDLGSAFYHFRSSNIGVGERIYLNVRPVFATTVIRWVVNNLVFSRAHPKCVNAKVGGPLEDRFDTIVIYLIDKDGVDKALAEIAKYQERLDVRNMFDHSAPRTTKPISKVGSRAMQGVSIGSEPPSLMIVENASGKLMYNRQSMSFGSLRESVFKLALERTLRKRGTKEDFLDEVIGLMQLIGLDPRRPNVQLYKDELEAL